MVTEHPHGHLLVIKGEREKKTGHTFLFPRLLFVDGLGFPFYKRSVAVVLVTELKIKVLSSGTYCFVMSLMTSWAAHPPEKYHETHNRMLRHQKVKREAPAASWTKKGKGHRKRRLLVFGSDKRLTNKSRNGMQLGRTVATHFMKIVVFGKTTALATQVV